MFHIIKPSQTTRMYIKAFFIIICIGLFSCKEKQADHDQLTEEVMAIHDKVMPELNVLLMLKTDLKKVETEETKDLILDQIIEIDKADDAMMTWMAEYKIPKVDSLIHPFLLKEKIRIQAVSDQMYLAIKNSKHLLDSLQIK